MKKAWVAICTAKRPEMLTACIRSIQFQLIPEGWEVAIAIIENDHKDHNRQRVLDLADNSGLPLHYFHESYTGIPFARNRAVDEALKAQVDWLIFIDDDETANSEWLAALLNASSTMVADAFQGPVRYIYPQSSPHWLEQKPRRSFTTGTPMDVAATNNVMFNMRLCKAEPEGLALRFDTRMRYTGGSDTDFSIVQQTKVS